MSVRKIVFWLHLVAGLVAGAIIAIMSFTGAVLAFEHEIVEWTARDVRRVEVPASTTALSLDEVLARVAASASKPPGRPSGITVSRDPGHAIAVNFGRDSVYYVNQYTGAVAKPGAARTRVFMQLMVDWHRYLAREGDRRPFGKAITGACNLAFLFLAVSGLWLWWPRAWNARVLRPSLWFVRGATGKTRDWNWHNVAGFWSLPVLVVLTASGAVIGYQWANDLVYRAAGEHPQAPGGFAPALSAEFPQPSPDTPVLTHAAVFARLTADFPAWKTITLREGLPPRRGAPAAPVPPSPPQSPQAADRLPYSATVTESGKPFVAANTQVVLNPFTGDHLDRSGYAGQTAGRQARTWLRYLHTGQALGWPGQLVAGLACVGGLLLVYTGFALSWRRFFTSRKVP